MENRIQLAEYFNDRDFKVGAEIGVADGRYSEILCQKIKDLHLYCVDPWSPYNGNWRSKKDQNEAFNRAKYRLQNYNAELVRKTSLQASVNYADETMDFVFIDGAHDFNNVMLDLILWTPKVKKGGVVSGHDYYDARTVKVVPAVEAYCKQNGIKLNVIPQATKVHRDDRVPCWWFEKL